MNPFTKSRRTYGTVLKNGSLSSREVIITIEYNLLEEKIILSCSGLMIRINSDELIELLNEIRVMNGKDEVSI